MHIRFKYHTGNLQVVWPVADKIILPIVNEVIVIAVRTNRVVQHQQSVLDK